MEAKPINPMLKQILELGPTLVFFLIYLRIKDETYTIAGTGYSGFIFATLIFVPVLLIAMGGRLRESVESYASASQSFGQSTAKDSEEPSLPISCGAANGRFWSKRLVQLAQGTIPQPVLRWPRKLGGNLRLHRCRERQHALRHQRSSSRKLPSISTM